MEKAIDKLNRIRSAMIARETFYGVLSMKLQFTERADIKTASTDGVHFFYNPVFIDGLTDSQIMGLIVHGVMHCTNGHFDRLQWRDLNQANEAGDYAINSQIIKAGFELPPGALLDSKYEGMGLEDIYQLIDLEKQKQQDKQKQESGNGDKSDSSGQQSDSSQSGSNTPDNGQSSPAGNQSATNNDSGNGQAQPGKPGNDPGQSGGFHMPESGNDESQSIDSQAIARQWEIATRQAAMVAAKQAGEMPGHIKSILDELNRPSINWAEYLSEFVNDKIQSDYSFNRPNKRYLQSGFSMPSLVPDGLAELVFFVDTSGSMPKKSFQRFVSELQGLLDSGYVQKIHVIQGDYKLCHAATYETGESISLEIFGGGGTRFIECMEYIRDNHYDASALIAFTDLVVKSHNIGPNPDIPTLWAQWGPKAWDSNRSIPEFGEIMPID